MNLKKVIFIFLLVVLMGSIYSYKIYGKEILTTGKDWLDTGEHEAASGSGLQFGSSYDKLEDLAGTLFGIGLFVILAGGMIIGAKFMLGNAEKRAELHKLLWIYLLGSVIILGALGIWRLVINILEDLV